MFSIRVMHFLIEPVYLVIEKTHFESILRDYW